MDSRDRFKWGPSYGELLGESNAFEGKFQGKKGGYGLTKKKGGMRIGRRQKTKRAVQSK